MTRLTLNETLLKKFEVEWFALGKLLVRTKGTKITAGQMKALHKNGAPVKIFAGGRTVANVNYGDVPDKDINTEPSIIVKSRGVIEFEYYENPFSHKNEMWSYHSKRESVSIKYVYYYLKMNERYFQNLGAKMQMPQIATPDTDKFLIPIPCPENPEKSLQIQAEIVRILDAFTAHTAELTAELTARKQQYNYYRDRLLSYKDGEVEWRPLGEIARLITKGTTPKTFEPEGINFIKLECFDNGRINPSKFMFISEETNDKELKRSRLEVNDILFAIAGATIGKCALVEEYVLPANTNQALAILRLGEKVHFKYVFYYLQTNLMREYIAKFNKTSAQPNLNLRQMSEFRIPVPSTSEQERIVSILDKFDALTNSITEGLPREIELRQKQYEYYRDLLLSFPKPGEQAA